MKTRSGFISNSSSTSFVILVKPERVEDVNFVLKYSHIGGVKPGVLVPERIKELNKEISELDKDLRYGNKLMSELVSLTNDKALDLVGLCNKIYTMERQQINSLRTGRVYLSRERMEKNKFNKLLKDMINDATLIKKELTEEIAMLTGYEKWSVISFEDDATWGHLHFMVDELVAKGEAIIIQKVTD